MSLTNPNKPVTEARLQEFYHRIKNFLGFTEMPSEDISKVVSPMPSVMSRLPVLFDESGTEQVVGWYKYANETKKPVYEKTVIAPLPSSYPSTGTAFLLDLTSLSIDKLVSLHWIATDGTSNQPIIAESQAWSITILYKKEYENKDGLWLWALKNGESWILNHSMYVTLKYTKTTDTPQ